MGFNFYGCAGPDGGLAHISMIHPTLAYLAFPVPAALSLTFITFVVFFALINK
jgi:hypothetical protein